MNKKINPLYLKDVFKKLNSVEECIANILTMTVPEVPSRDIEVLKPSMHPDKKGLSKLEGQQRLLHDLASIELQAMELCLRTLMDFQGLAPQKFLDELKVITLEERNHCLMCLKALEKIDGYWGMFPCHIELWKCTFPTDTILERLLKVHLYLEGSGLDAGNNLLMKLTGVPFDVSLISDVVEVIAKDELNHVRFGTFWFHKFCKEAGDSSYNVCKRILTESKTVLPKRNEKINRDIRLKAGFLESEIELLCNYQQSPI